MEFDDKAVKRNPNNEKTAVVLTLESSSFTGQWENVTQS